MEPWQLQKVMRPVYPDSEDEMSYLEDTIEWQSIERIDEWLDANAGPDYQDQPLAQDWARVGKVIEELGEAIRALIGYTGQNPRKGVTHSQQEMIDELGDTAITAILAMQHFTKNSSESRQIIREKIESIYRRAFPYKVTHS